MTLSDDEYARAVGLVDEPVMHVNHTCYACDAVIGVCLGCGSVGVPGTPHACPGSWSTSRTRHELQWLLIEMLEEADKLSEGKRDLSLQDRLRAEGRCAAMKELVERVNKRLDLRMSLDQRGK